MRFKNNHTNNYENYFRGKKKECERVARETLWQPELMSSNSTQAKPKFRLHSRVIMIDAP